MLQTNLPHLNSEDYKQAMAYQHTGLFHAVDLLSRMASDEPDFEKAKLLYLAVDKLLEDCSLLSHLHKGIPPNADIN
jgi:hypothetical protein